MEITHIKNLLSTICQFNNVRITQTFTSEDRDLIVVRCVPNTTTLELTFLETSTVEQYNSVDAAAAVIYKHLKHQPSI